MAAVSAAPTLNAGDTPAATGFSRNGRPSSLVLGEKLFLAASVVLGQRNLGRLQTHLAQRAGSSAFALLSRDSAYAQDSKSYRYCRCHFCLD
jgi:hypothetical protein